MTLKMSKIELPAILHCLEGYFTKTAYFQEIPLVIAARLFDRPINKLSIKELNDALHGRKQGMIGCHWIYATVSQN